VIGGHTWTDKDHAKDQVVERNLILGDVLYYSKMGLSMSRRKKQLWNIGSIKCNVQRRTLKTGRFVVAIPDWKHEGIKIVTVMWVDEPLVRGG
jgi:hypothetical protein